jgi:predicted nucleic acid-binding Zn ribbon protein
LHFNSVEQILTQLEQQPGWEYRQLLQCWERTVNQNIAQQTRPLYINRQVLYVATSSAARSQELSFQRYTLLKRLNKQLTFALKDIRFSSSQWHQKTNELEIKQSIFTKSEKAPNRSAFPCVLRRRGVAAPFHGGVSPTISDRQKSTIVPDLFASLPLANNHGNSINDLSPQDKAKNAAQRWIKTIEEKSSLALLCPNCNSTTPKAEIERWNLCYHCVAQKWSKEYRPPISPSIK